MKPHQFSKVVVSTLLNNLYASPVSTILPDMQVKFLFTSCWAWQVINYEKEEISPFFPIRPRVLEKIPSSFLRLT